MYSLSIQGTEANNFQFVNNSGHEFRSLVESLILNYVTLICSKFRTDLIYFSDKDVREEILKAWFRVVGVQYSPKLKKEFVLSSGENEVLENYFVSLVSLAKKPDQFFQYQKQLNLTIDQEQNHPIHKKIVGCAHHLASSTKSFNLPIIKADKHSIAYYLLKNTKSFASIAAKNYIDN